MNMGMHLDSVVPPSGRLVGYSRADERWITDTLTRQIRRGTRAERCNPGAAEACGVGFRAPVPGAVRASLGAASDARDLTRLTSVVVEAARRAAGERTAWRGATRPVSRLLET